MVAEGEAGEVAPHLEVLTEEGIFRNTIGGILAALGLLLPCLLRCEAFRQGLAREGEV